MQYPRYCTGSQSFKRSYKKKKSFKWIEMQCNTQQYLRYCTGCNRTNPILPFNSMVNYFDLSPIQVGNPCLTSVFIFASQNLRPCLVELLNNSFLVFKQHYTLFHTLFHPHILPKGEIVRTYVFHMLGTFVTILCNWLIF